MAIVERDGILVSIPPEIAWLIPVVLPFIAGAIGLLVGVIVKKGLKLLVVIVALVIVLVATGVLSLTFNGFFNESMKVLPYLVHAGSRWLNVLPYSSVAFLIGAARGFLFA